MAMVKFPFNGQLNPSEIYSTIYNFIISQAVKSDRLKALDTGLVRRFRTDGTLYGDTKLFYDSDILKTYEWRGDAEAANLLALHRAPDPTCQAVTIDQFRFVPVTTDNYLSKRSWGTEGAFNLFKEVTLTKLSKTKALYESRLINTYVGTVTSAASRSDIEIPLADLTDAKEEAMTIAQYMANLLVDLKDSTRDFNELGFMDAVPESDVIFIWNSEWLNRITKFDLPTIFHKSDLMDKFGEEVLSARYFGVEIDSSNIANFTDSGSGSSGKPITSAGKYAPGAAHANGTLRSMIETDYTVSGSEKPVHVFPGDEIPSGVDVTANSGVYFVDKDIICKVISKDAIKYMSAFEVNTSFFNPLSLTESNYLIFGYSHPDYLKGEVVLTVHSD